MSLTKLLAFILLSVFMLAVGVRYENKINNWVDIYIKGESKEPFDNLNLNHYDSDIEVWDVAGKLDRQGNDSKKSNNVIFKGRHIIAANITQKLVNVAFNSGVILSFSHRGDLIKRIDIRGLLNDFILYKMNGGIRTVLWITRNIVFVYYTAQNQLNQSYEMRGALIDTSKDDISDYLILGEFKEEDHFSLGGGAVFDKKDNKIFLSVGVASKVDDIISGSKAQDNSTLFGKTISIGLVRNAKSKVLKLKLSDPVVISKGHRNAQGMTLLNNRLFSVEHGPRGGDELNLILKNGNYGWNKFSYGYKYGKPDGDYDNWSEGFNEPNFYFTPSIGISDVYPCPKIFLSPGYRNCLLISSMHDASFYVTKFFQGTDQVQSIERVTVGERIRKIRSFGDSIFLFTDCITKKCNLKIIKIGYLDI